MCSAVSDTSRVELLATSQWTAGRHAEIFPTLSLTLVTHVAEPLTFWALEALADLAELTAVAARLPGMGW